MLDFYSYLKEDKENQGPWFFLESISFQPIILAARENIFIHQNMIYTVQEEFPEFLFEYPCRKSRQPHSVAEFCL